MGAPGQAVPAFIFGEMRSGTNMLIRTLAKSRDTECFFENDKEAFNAYRLRDKKQVSKLVLDSRAKVVVFKPIADSQNARALLETHNEHLALLQDTPEHPASLHRREHRRPVARFEAHILGHETLGRTESGRVGGIRLIGAGRASSTTAH